MLSPNELKVFKIFSDLKDDELDKIAPIVNSAEFEENSIVFKEGEPAENIYILTSGKVLLEQRITDKMTITVDTLKSGDFFGIASIMDVNDYTMDAVVAEKTGVLVINSHEFASILSKNPGIGFKVLKQVCFIVKKQADERTDLFVRSISSHPDFDLLD